MGFASNTECVPTTIRDQPEHVGKGASLWIDVVKQGEKQKMKIDVRGIGRREFIRNNHLTDQ